jgi:hypothetical protein
LPIPTRHAEDHQPGMSTRNPERQPPYDGAVDRIIDLETTVRAQRPWFLTRKSGCGKRWSVIPPVHKGWRPAPRASEPRSGQLVTTQVGEFSRLVTAVQGETVQGRQACATTRT